MFIQKSAASLILFLIFCGSYALGYDEFTKEKLRELFKEEEQKKAPFVLLKDSYGEFNPIGGFADGRYKLKKYSIEKVDRHIYILHLLFKKKKGVFSFQQNVDIPFWYDGRIIVFLTKKGKFRFRVPYPEEVIIKDKNKYIIRTNQPRELKVILPDVRAKYYLHIRFEEW